jgi:hypothetical protein
MELVHVGAVFPAVVATCCAAGTNRRMLGNVVPSAVMLLAMLDHVTGTQFLWPVAWTVLLLLVAPIPVIIARLRPATNAGMSAAGMPLHASLGLIAMAGLTAVGSAHLATTGPHQHGGAGAMGAVLYPGIAAYLVFTLGLVIHLSRRPRRDALPRVEVASMGLSLALMALAG